MKAALRNISGGYRSVLPVGGEAVDFDPGEVAEVELSEQELSDAVATEWFEIDEGATLSSDDDEGGVDPDAGKPSLEAIRDAVAELDRNNDDHWTNAGLPAVDAVADILDAKVSRAEIEEAVPGFERPEPTTE